MGMAASQARYIELTCRKTNVEYEGQQINQQRTALANQSAGLFSQLLALNVPTPPSTQDFTKLEYKFSDGINSDTITDISPLTNDPNYNSTVTYYYNTTVNTGLAKTRTDLGVNKVLIPGTNPPEYSYWLTNGLTGTDQQNKVQLTHCSTSDPNYADDMAALNQIVLDQHGNISSTNPPTGYNSSNPAGTIGNVYKYTANGQTYYYSATDITNAAATFPLGGALPLTAYYTANIDKKVTAIEKAYVTKDASGRYSTIKLASQNTAFDLTAVNNIDEAGYQQAMNEYTYQQFLYQKEVEDVNARTEVIQVEDRTLEMKLKQLDTEQEALKTEMEAVKKVIDKNIEETFKTFGS